MRNSLGSQVLRGLPLTLIVEHLDNPYELGQLQAIQSLVDVGILSKTVAKNHLAKCYLRLEHGIYPQDWEHSLCWKQPPTQKVIFSYANDIVPGDIWLHAELGKSALHDLDEDEEQDSKSLIPWHAIKSGLPVDTTKRIFKRYGRNLHSSFPLLQASLWGHRHLVEYILQEIDLAIVRDSPLGAAALGGHLSLVKLFVGMGMNVDQPYNGQSPFLLACERGHVTIIKYLLDATAGTSNASIRYDSGSNGWKALMLAAGGGKEAACKYLLQRLNLDGGDANFRSREGQTALVCAIKRRKTEMVRILIEAGADVNARNSEGQTALVCAIERRQIEMVRILIEAGADANVRSREGQTALECAIKRRKTEMVRILIEAGADVNARTSEGETPLLVAAQESDADMVHILVRAGADVNVKNRFGDTLLAVSVKEANEDFVRMFIQANVDVNLKSDNGESPISIAIQDSHDCIFHMLTQAGADRRS